MTQGSNRWAIVLAAGAGSRLSALTSMVGGTPVPKQFCSLNGGPSLVEEAVARARALVPEERTVVVVAADQERHWRNGVAGACRDNLIVQPANRGTGMGILLGAAAVFSRDPDASVALLPSDHFVAQESVLRRSLARALATAEDDPKSIMFLGVRPDHPDPELGYIVRGAPLTNGGYRIAQFVEKPEPSEAVALVTEDAFWNVFILAARVRALLGLIGRRCPVETSALLDIGSREAWTPELETLYANLPHVDFSREIVEVAEAPLSVLPVPSCGWSDLGTPSRVAECLSRLGACGPSEGRARHAWERPNLAEAHAASLFKAMHGRAANAQPRRLRDAAGAARVA